MVAWVGEATPLFYESSPEQMRHLAARDARLGLIIDRVGPIRRRIWPESYAALMRAIIGQQISGQAQASIWGRFCATFPAFDASELAALPPEHLRQCGISRAKATSMIAVAQAFAQGRISHASLTAMSDGDLSHCLQRFKGIGPWTVEMLLIFTFQRPNVLSCGDLGIRRGMEIVYGYEQVTTAICQRHREAYSPYATLAGMYLWEAVRLGPKWATR